MFPRGTAPPTYHSAATFARDVTNGLIVEIVQLLMGSDASFHDLKEDLNTLQQMLTLTGMAIEAYEHTPLG